MNKQLIKEKESKKYSFDEIFAILVDVKCGIDLRKKVKVNLDGDMIKVTSLRLSTFKQKGTKCVCCGAQAEYFRKTYKFETFHLNLYGIKNGKELLFTKDHIIPKSKGGRDNLNNLQTMCVECNFKKGNNYE